MTMKLLGFKQYNRNSECEYRFCCRQSAFGEYLILTFLKICVLD